MINTRSILFSAWLVLAAGVHAQLPVIHDLTATSIPTFAADDMDGDGCDDFLSGGRLPAIGGYSEVKLISGASGLLLRDLAGLGDPAYGSAGLFANVTHRCGDIDMDGFDDYAASGGMIFSGGHLADLVHGVAGPRPLVIMAVPSPDFGRVKAVGDLDGDGRSEFMTFTSVADAAIPGYLGYGFSIRHRLRSGLDGSIIYTGWMPSYFYSDRASYCGLGDIDGDGIGDVATSVGRDNSPFAPTVQILSGGAMLAAGTGTTPSNAATIATISPPPGVTSIASVTFGTNLVSLGDTDGDGKGELAVDAISATSGTQTSMQTFVFRSSDWTLRYSTLSPLLTDGASWALPTMHALGDTNGDGVGDFANVRIGGQPSGVSVVNGGYFEVRSGTDGHVIYTRTGLTSNGLLGFGFDGGKDINGDGLADIVVSEAGSSIAPRRLYAIGMSGGTRYTNNFTAIDSRPLKLGWTSTGAHAGFVYASGAQPWGSGVIVVSNARIASTINTQVAGLSLYVDINTVPNVSFPITFDGSGGWSYAVSFFEPGLDGLTYFLQAAQASPFLAESNGLQVLYSN